MKKILTIIGARPQIIKAAAISRAISNHFSNSLAEKIVHTGQHYDENMSGVFFEELGIPRPDYNLGVGSGSHGSQTAKMTEGIEQLLIDEKPDALLVYGDTNSTLAGAIAAAKIHIPVVHVEAGLRSFSKSMPEEINRIVCDHCSTLLFSPTKSGIDNLIGEGFKIGLDAPYSIDSPGVFHCGDIMYDNSLHFADIAKDKSNVLEENGLREGGFILATVHRDNNTDIPERLSGIFRAFDKISREYEMDIMLPLHPRTRKILKQHSDTELTDSLHENPYLKIVEPVSFLDMVRLEQASFMIMTDSGGVQKESYFFEKPCVILRPETEWVELVDNGNAIIADADTQQILNAYSRLSTKNDFTFPAYYGDGRAAEFICQTMINNI